MVDYILKILRPGVYNFRSLNRITAKIVFMKNPTWIEDDIKDTKFSCLLGQPVYKNKEKI